MKKNSRRELKRGISGNVSFNSFFLFFLVVGKGEEYLVVKAEFVDKINQIN